ncbi:hypothetical protein NBO_916g0002 [Nosema bombycis CQ1]|uniref:Uncharacterized protein n=1 Tax=Nosema bombycis (strain CQ1 / CVCC 102059) TaxID=578461 RepID=R0M138_NOSB1|nr:hypothetical protein NBO_916g0002 [Nosema bombycis CQ1]|eukprot:EOB11744.1 hypothetical protein NBO_916g0002 [Nosema bombycis CQ1]
MIKIVSQYAFISNNLQYFFLDHFIIYTSFPFLILLFFLLKSESSMNIELLKKTLVFVSCLIFLEDEEDLRSGFKIIENEDVSYFKLLSKNKSDCIENDNVNYINFELNDRDCKLGYFNEGLQFHIFNEEKTECMEFVYEQDSNLTDFDLFFNINVSLIDQDMKNNYEKIVIKNDYNKITGRSNHGIQWEVKNEDEIVDIDEFEDAPGYSYDTEDEATDDDFDVSGMVNAIENSKVKPRKIENKSFKSSLKDVKSRLEPIYECPVMENASSYNDKHELFTDLRDNLEKSQNYFIRTLRKEHVLDFTYAIPINDDVLEDYTLITLFSSQYLTNGYKTIKKENDEVVIKEIQRKLGRRESQVAPKINSKEDKVKSDLMDINKTKIKETQRYIFVRKTNGESEKILLRKKTGECCNNVQVYLSYFGKKQSFNIKRMLWGHFLVKF